MKKAIILSLVLFFTMSNLFAQETFSAKIISEDNNNFFVKETNGNYYVTFEVTNINNKQLNALKSAIQNYRGVLNVTTSEINSKTYIFKVEFYEYAKKTKYYAFFFKSNNITKLLIKDKVINPNDLIETK